MAEGRAGLAGEHRCITLDVPLGGHSIALDGEPDLSLFGVARIVADFLEALELSEVTIVANDTGGAVSQALVGRHPERVGRLVLTSCDAFENFPPKAVAYLPWLARVPGAFWSWATLCGCGRSSACRSPTAGRATGRSSARSSTPS